MKSYLKLVNFEVNRSLKFYVFILVFIATFQIAGVIINSLSYMRSVKGTMRDEQMSVNEYITNFEIYSFTRFLNSEWFLMSITFGIAVLMIYVFVIWYRDWFGKSKFMYRLLMLPTSRIHIYFAKLTTIILFVLGLIGIQIILIFLEQNISNWLIASELRSNISYIDLFMVSTLSFLFPHLLSDFILSYGLGLVFVSVLFTAILLERSYHLKGIILAVVYGVLVVVVLFAPLFLNSFYGYYLYPIEILGISVLIATMILASAIWLANYLLKYKIKV